LSLALENGRKEIAKLLASKGAVCTEEEKGRLGKIFSDFEQEMERERTEQVQAVGRRGSVPSQQGGIGGQMGSSQIGELQIEIGKWKETAESLRLQLEEKSKQKEQIDKVLSSTQAQLSSTSLNLNFYSQKLREVEQTAEALQQEKITANNKIRELEETAEALRQDKITVQQELSTTHGKFQEIAQALRQAKSDLEQEKITANNKIRELEETAATLQDKLRELEETAAGIQQEKMRKDSGDTREQSKDQKMKELEEELKKIRKSEENTPPHQTIEIHEFDRHENQKNSWKWKQWDRFPGGNGTS